MFFKSIIKKPYMFRSLLYDHPQGSSFVLSAFTTFRLLAVNDQTTHRQVHRTHIHIDSIRPHNKKVNDEAKSGKVVKALSTKDNP
jgi:hypothetical protein